MTFDCSTQLLWLQHRGTTENGSKNNNSGETATVGLGINCSGRRELSGRLVSENSLVYLHLLSRKHTGRKVPLIDCEIYIVEADPHESTVSTYILTLMNDQLSGLIIDLI